MKKISSIAILFFLMITTTHAQQLEYFINHGLSSSPLLKDYYNQLELSKADSLLIRAGQRPQVNSTSQILYAPYNNNIGYDAAISNGGNYSSVVGVSQYIFNSRTLKNKYENINLQNQSIKNTTKISTHDLIKTITGQYLTSLADYYEIKNLQEYNELLNQEKGILQQLVAQAVYKQSDYLALEIEARTSEISYNQAQSQYLTDASILRQICGINDTTRLIPMMPKIEIQPKVSFDKSPLFLQYSIDSLKLKNEQESIMLQYRPKINWFADAGLMSSTPDMFYRHFGVSAGVNMTFPIFDGHQRKIEYEKINIRENTRSNYRNYFTNQYNRQIEQFNSELKANRKNIELLKSQEISAKELIVLLKAQLNSGNTTITELINAMKNYLSVTHNLYQEQLKEFEIVNELNYLMQQ